MISYNSWAETNLDGEVMSAFVFLLATITPSDCCWQYMTSYYVCDNWCELYVQPGGHDHEFAEVSTRWGYAMTSFWQLRLPCRLPCHKCNCYLDMIKRYQSEGWELYSINSKYRSLALELFLIFTSEQNFNIQCFDYSLAVFIRCTPAHCVYVDYLMKTAKE